MLDYFFFGDFHVDILLTVLMNLQKVCVSFFGGERSRTKNSCKTPRLLRQEKELWCTHRPVTHVNKSLAIVFPIHFVHFSLIVTKISKLPELRFVLVISNLLQKLSHLFCHHFFVDFDQKSSLAAISHFLAISTWMVVHCAREFAKNNICPIFMGDRSGTKIPSKTPQLSWQEESYGTNSTNAIKTHGTRGLECLSLWGKKQFLICKSIKRLLGCLETYGSWSTITKMCTKTHRCPSSQTPPISEPKTPQNSAAPLNRFSVTFGTLCFSI